MQTFGVLSLLPVAVVIVLVFLTRSSLPSGWDRGGGGAALWKRFSKALAGCGLWRHGKRPMDLAGAGLRLFRQPGGLV